MKSTATGVRRETQDTEGLAKVKESSSTGFQRTAENGKGSKRLRPTLYKSQGLGTSHHSLRRLQFQRVPHQRDSWEIVVG